MRMQVRLGACNAPPAHMRRHIPRCCMLCARPRRAAEGQAVQTTIGQQCYTPGPPCRASSGLLHDATSDGEGAGRSGAWGLGDPPYGALGALWRMAPARRLAAQANTHMQDRGPGRDFAPAASRLSLRHGQVPPSVAVRACGGVRCPCWATPVALPTLSDPSILLEGMPTCRKSTIAGLNCAAAAAGAAARLLEEVWKATTEAVHCLRASG